MSIKIEAIKAKHICGFHRVLGIVARERRFLTFLDAPPLAATERYVKQIIRNGHPLFVATTLEGDVVGWCGILPAGRPVHAHVGVLGMALTEPFRGQGFGRRLIDGTLAKAHRLGLWRTELSVYADNAPAIRLYQTIGFEIEGIKKQAAQIDGRFIDVLMMAKLVVPMSGDSREKLGHGAKCRAA